MKGREKVMEREKNGKEKVACKGEKEENEGWSGREAGAKKKRVEEEEEEEGKRRHFAASIAEENFKHCLSKTPLLPFNVWENEIHMQISNDYVLMTNGDKK